MPALVEKQLPGKGAFSLTGEAFYDISTSTLWITLRGTYQGADPVTLQTVHAVVYNPGGLTCALCSCSSEIAPLTDCTFTSADPDTGAVILVCEGNDCPPLCYLINTFTCASRDAEPVQLTLVERPSTLHPNTYFKIVAAGDVTITTPENARVIVTISYCYVDGCSMTGTILKIRS